MIVEPYEITKAFKLHYEGILQTFCPSTEMILECLGSMQSRVTEQMNEMLSRAFTTTEIETAIYQMGSLKSLGPDGYVACNYG